MSMISEKPQHRLSTSTAGILQMKLSQFGRMGFLGGGNIKPTNTKRKKKHSKIAKQSRRINRRVK